VSEGQSKRLPLRERVLNAFAAGFAISIIADRLHTSQRAINCILYKARKERGDTRAALIDQAVSSGRKRSAHKIRWAQAFTSPRNDGTRAVPFYDQFPDLPEINDWHCLRPIPTTVDQTAVDVPYDEK